MNQEEFDMTYTTSNQTTSSSVVLTTTIAAVCLGTAFAYYWYKKQSKKPLFVIKKLKGPITLCDSDTKYSLKLIEKKKISHDTRSFVFGLPTNNHILGLPVGKHVHFSAKINDKLVVRPYTPVSSDDDVGFVEFVIKIYFKNTHPNFPDGGKMSQHLETLQIGDSIELRGPSGLITYKGNGYFNCQRDKNSEGVIQHYHKIGLIAGGTGITPMLQIINDVLKNPTDPTHLSLLFANQSEDDILLKDKLDHLATKHSDRFKIWYTIDKEPPHNNWKYSTGFITTDMISDHLPVKIPTNFKSNVEEYGCSDNYSVVLMCGPPPMIKFACEPALNKLNFPVEHRLKF